MWQVFRQGGNFSLDTYKYSDLSSAATDSKSGFDEAWWMKGSESVLGRGDFCKS